ncbi:MAG: tRNA (guanosine(46)-N7)-methyltransferase TrmB [Planctomycetes bacterium]|nr:tRNA (guanosine(46)-N7)-methyltransferase TrmB [Planctomycetota bacterium]
MRKPKRLPFEELEPYLLPRPPLLGPPAPSEVVDWSQLFANTNPVEIEVGFGKGLFLTTVGTANPQVNYLGIEIVNKYVLFTATRLARRNLRNVVVTTADARIFLRERVAAGSVRTVHVYFPDPWWKHRHQKRIVFTAVFVQEVERVLRPGGRLILVTDVADYMAMARETVLVSSSFLQEAEAPGQHEPTHDLDYLTNFERKFRREGRPIYRAAWATR